MPRGRDAGAAAGSLAGEVPGMILWPSGETVAGTSALVRHRNLGPTFQALTKINLAAEAATGRIN
jgi:hypothetical protein